MVVANDWTLCAHPLLLDQLEKLTTVVEKAKAKDPDGWTSTANAKLLAAMRLLMFETVPGDPARPEYRQGSTLGPARKHWFRARFGNGRFRLFFRYDSRFKVIIFAWVNDETTLRTYGSTSDAYAVFRGMLDKGDPPDDWAALLQAASADPAATRLNQAKGRCEHCRRPHGRDVLHLGDGTWWDEGAAIWRDGRGRGLRYVPAPDAVPVQQPRLDGIGAPSPLLTTRVVLASAHLNHDPGDNRLRNLAALCQRCHLIHDAPEHRRRRWFNAFRVRAIGDLFA